MISKDSVGVQRAAKVLAITPSSQNPTAEVLIRTVSGISRTALESKLPGIQIFTQAGDIFSASVPIKMLPELAKHQEIIFVSIIRKAILKNDVARSSTTDAGDYVGVAAPQGLSGYTGVEGQGVVVGVVDSGLDFRHPDFLTSDNKSRILYLWDQTIAGAPPSGYSYGTEWDKAQLDQQLSNSSCRLNITNCTNITERDTDGHGTHVTGTAASNNATYTGMAPKADLIIVKTDFSHFLDGVNYIFQKAAALGKAAVVNLSLGGQYNPHDGTANEDLAIANLTGPGKIVVAAAGNEQGSGLHGSATIAGTYTFNLTAQDNISAGGIQFWHSDRYTVAVRVNGGLAVIAANGAASSGYSSGVKIDLDNASGGLNPNNNDNQVLISFDGSISVGWPITITYTYTGGTGDKRVDGWCSENGFDLQFDTPDPTMLTNSPGNSAGAISVAAYVSRNLWTSTEPNNYCLDQYGDTYPTTDPHCGTLRGLGAIASFSSPGPLRDSSLKPEISAPGDKIISTLSQSSPIEAQTIVADGKHRTMEGTSMATPRITGIVALHLQQNPNLTPSQVKAIFAAHARSDSTTGALPNASFGYGKVLGTPPAWPAPAAFTGAPVSTSKIHYQFTATAQNHLGVRIQNAFTQFVYGDFIPSTTSFDLINLSTNTPYSTNVSVYNDAGASTTTAPTIYTLAAAPLSPRLTAVGSSSGTTTWGTNQNPAGTVFTLEASLDNFTTVSTSSRTIASTGTLYGLIPNTSYYFRVKAENGTGIPTSYTATVSSVSLAAIPSGIALTQLSSTSLHVVWQPNSNPIDTQYELSLSSTNFTAAISTPMAFSSASAVTEKEITGLLSSTTYYARVRAKNRMGAITAFTSTSMFLPPSITQDISPGQPASVAFGNAVLTIPSRAFSESISVTVQSPGSFPTSNSYATPLTGVNAGIDITTNKSLTPLKQLTLTLSYTTAQAAGLDESRFLIARYEPTRAVWIPYASSPSPTTNQVTAQIDHLSLFQIMMGTPAGALSAANIKVFPNPVRPSRGQTLKFSGLPAGADVKIFTFQGDLVRKLTADPSGIAQWDVKNDVGQPVASEVYLALIKSGSDTKTVKIMVER